MKKIIIYILVIAGSFILPSCKKFLNIQPIDKLTGNNFYKSKEDVVANIYDLSRIFFGKINETHFIGAVGEYRSGEVQYEPQSDNGPAREFVEYLGRNDLISIIAGDRPWSGFYNFIRITDWTGYYRVVQGANILIAKLNEGIPGVSAKEANEFKAEAAFIRSLAYFFMVRLYGDVPYYIDAYHTQALPRENMVSVLNKSMEDLKSYKDYLPWTYADPALKGVRASKGSIIALLMEMDMWNAGFDKPNAEKYYNDVVELGAELVASNAYKLLNIAEWSTVIKGRSDESLFEFYRSVNYGDNNEPVAPFGDMFLHYPYKRPEYTHRISFAYFRAEYMQKLYLGDAGDKRATTWYNEDIYADNGKFMMTKFAVNSFATGEEDRNPDNTFLIFRYAGSLLTYAEALAETADEGKATTILNLVRGRAEALAYAGSGGQDLKDFIFLERSRELMGEGDHYFDLVRTRRILSSQWSYNVLTLDKFNRGAWTWPINSNALSNNPFMTLNTYWTNGGN